MFCKRDSNDAIQLVFFIIAPFLFRLQKIYEKIICSGKETYLQNCVWGERQRKSPCKHYNDAGVRCNVPLRRKQRNKMEVTFLRGSIVQ